MQQQQLQQLQQLMSGGMEHNEEPTGGQQQQQHWDRYRKGASSGILDQRQHHRRGGGGGWNNGAALVTSADGRPSAAWQGTEGFPVPEGHGPLNGGASPLAAQCFPHSPRGGEGGERQRLPPMHFLSMLLGEGFDSSASGEGSRGILSQGQLVEAIGGAGAAAAPGSGSTAAVEAEREPSRRWLEGALGGVHWLSPSVDQLHQLQELQQPPAEQCHHGYCLRPRRPLREFPFPMEEDTEGRAGGQGSAVETDDLIEKYEKHLHQQQHLQQQHLQQQQQQQDQQQRLGHLLRSSPSHWNMGQMVPGREMCHRHGGRGISGGDGDGAVDEIEGDLLALNSGDIPSPRSIFSDDLPSALAGPPSGDRLDRFGPTPPSSGGAWLGPDQSQRSVFSDDFAGAFTARPSASGGATIRDGLIVNGEGVESRRGRPSPSPLFDRLSTSPAIWGPELHGQQDELGQQNHRRRTFAGDDGDSEGAAAAAGRELPSADRAAELQMPGRSKRQRIGGAPEYPPLLLGKDDIGCGDGLLIQQFHQNPGLLLHPLSLPGPLPDSTTPSCHATPSCPRLSSGGSARESAWPAGGGQQQVAAPHPWLRLIHPAPAPAPPVFPPSGAASPHLGRTAGTPVFNPAATCGLSSDPAAAAAGAEAEAGARTGIGDADFRAGRGSGGVLASALPTEDICDLLPPVQTHRLLQGVAQQRRPMQTCPYPGLTGNPSPPLQQLLSPLSVYGPSATAESNDEFADFARRYLQVSETLIWKG